MSGQPPSRLYRTLLRLFPRRFVELRGEEMEQLFSDMRKEWIEERGRLGPGFWIAVLWDTGSQAVREWVATFGEVLRTETTQPLGAMMTGWASDLRFAFRQIKRQPTYAAMVILLMTIGIAGNTAVFRVVNGLFLRPLPFDHAEELVDLNETAPSWDLEYLSVAYRDFDTWRARNHTFQSMAAIDVAGGNFLADGEPRRVEYMLTTHDIDDVLRIEPAMGRFYGPAEDHPDGPRTMMLSEGFWRSEFGGDPGVLGRTVSLDGEPTEIIGVLPPEAAFFAKADVWIPLRQVRSEWHGWGIVGIGRLNPGVSLSAAREDLLSIHKGMIDEFEVNEISSPVVNSLRERYLGDYQLGAGFLLAAVGIVLLIACANIAGLMFARGLARGPELGVRIALGAPRRRIVRQLLTESMLLALIGSFAGAAIGIAGSNALVSTLTDQFPAWVRFDLDGRVLLFTLAVTAGAVALFGLIPALRASRASHSFAASLRSTASRSRRRSLSLLVTAEVALALALLVIGGLSVMDSQLLTRVDPGFEADGLVSYSINLPPTRYESDESRLAFADGYLSRLSVIPGVESAALTSAMPLAGHWGTFFSVDGAPPRTEDEGNPVVLNRVVSPSYFETLGVEFALGGPFDEFDGREEGSRVVVVNERFVETHLGHLENPVGARIVQGTTIGDNPHWMTIIGVTRNVKHYGVDEEMRPGVYQPMRQVAIGGFSVALRVRGEPAPVITRAREVTRNMDVELPVYGVERMTETLDESLWTRWATSWMIGAFSLVALLLAVAGIYGVISYTVGQRVKEISIRMALGAKRGDVLRQVIGQGMRLVSVGILIGLVLVLALASPVSALLIGVKPTEPAVYAGVTVVLLLVGALANYVPARRAASVDPAGALRGE